MGQSLIKGFLDSKALKPEQIFASNRSPRKVNKLGEVLGIHVVGSNEELFEKCDIVFLAVKPQDLAEALEPLYSVIHEGHLLVSIAAGIPIREIKKLVSHAGVCRVMPNTPVGIQRGVIGFSTSGNGSHALEFSLKEMLGSLGLVVDTADDEQMSALAVGCGSGTGFVLEIMTYWQEWLLEYGFSSEQARQMAVQTFIGASLMAEATRDRSLEELQDQVASKKGITAAGLDSMRENEIERGLRIAFEKAVMRDRQLAKSIEQAKS